MSLAFEELDFQITEIGEVSLRRRREPRLNDATVFEVKLGDEFLMSSLFTVGETALADLALERLDRSCVVVVGGLGLGYTAHAALAHSQVAELLVIEALAPVVAWHEQGLVPLGPGLSQDPRCRFICADFFAAATSVDGFDVGESARRFDAILLDIDHSPRHRLDADQNPFYDAAGLRRLSAHLLPGGVFAMWSNDPPYDDFVNALESVFLDVEAAVIEFPNPYTQTTASCTIYLANAAAAADA